MKGHPQASKSVRESRGPEGFIDASSGRLLDPSMIGGRFAITRELTSRRTIRRRRLVMESLEPRLPLSATGLPQLPFGDMAGPADEPAGEWLTENSEDTWDTPSREPQVGVDWFGQEILVKLKDPDSLAASAPNHAPLVGPYLSIPQSHTPDNLISVLIASGATGSRSAFRSIDGESVGGRGLSGSTSMRIDSAPKSEYFVARNELSRWHRLELDAAEDIQAKLDVIRQLPEVEYAEPNYGWKPLNEIPPIITGLPDNTTDPQYDTQWFHDATQTWKAWDHLNRNGVHPGGDRTVVVAVIDTGVDYSHEDLVGNMWVNPGEIPGNGIDDDGNGFVDDIHGASTVSNQASHSGDPDDLHGHGTHVAGVIGAQAFNGKGGVGVAFNTQIMALRAGQASGVFTIDDVAEAILYAADNGADVINMSFGGYQRSQIVADALEVALNQAVLVAAAGNDGIPISVAPLYPAAFPYVLGVEASTPTGALASFSNSGYEVRAPGASIYSTLPQSNNYASWSGTSMATPVVSGIAALMRSYFWQREIYSNRFIMGSIAASGSVVDAYKAITEPPQPGVSLHSDWLFDDEAIGPQNDGDGRVDAGETLHVGIEVINRSGFADQVVATLEAQAPGAVLPDPYVTITTDTIQLGSIGPFALKDNSILYDAAGNITGVGQPFVFTVSPDTPNDHVISFKVTFTFEDGWNETQPTLTRVDRFQYIVQRGKNVPRVISEDLDLTADNLWIIGGPVLIEPQATLRVLPGTEVQWGAISSDPYNPGPQAGNLIVRGRLIVEGTEQRPANLFPSYLVSGQRTNIAVEAGGRADIQYAKIRNPNLTSIATADHVYFDWDAHSVQIHVNQITNTHFHRLLGGGSISFGMMDTSAFSAGRLNPPNARITNSVFLQDNETNHRLILTKSQSFTDRLTNDRGDLGLFYGERLMENGDTYVTLPVEFASLDLAETIANFYGGHVASAATSEEWDILRSYLSTAPGFRAYGSSNFDRYLIGLSDQPHPNRWEWLDGSEFEFDNWADGQPPVVPENTLMTSRIVQALFVTNNGASQNYSWQVLNEQASLRSGNTNRASWNSFILRLPGEWTNEQLQSLAGNGNLIEHVKQNLAGSVRHNAFLSKTWDPNINHWMRIQSTGPADGHAIFDDNFWGTDNTQLIDHMISDYHDTFTTPRVHYQPAPSHGAASTWPFVESMLINGMPAHTVPEIGAGPTQFTMTFNRDMDPEVNPFVTFGPSAPFTDFRVAPANAAGGWITPRTWQGTFWVTPMTGEGFHQMRVSGAVAADDAWLVSGHDVGRFRFEVKTMGVAGMLLTANGEEGHIRLNWNQDDFDLLAGYHLYRSTSPDGPFQRISSTVLPPQQTTFVDWDVLPAQNLYYKFTVVQTDLTESAFSNVASAAAVDTVPPQITHAPKNTAQPGTGFGVRAVITDNVGIESATIYYRPRGSSGNFTPLPMFVLSGNEWLVTVPGIAMQPPGIEYYLTATDGVSQVYHGTAAAPHAVIVEAKPTLMTISPSRGTSQGGTAVTLSGAMFQPGARVWFGEQEATDVVVVTSTQVTATVPAHFPARVDVRVVNPDGGEAVKLGGFEFVHEGSVLSLPTITADQGAIIEIPVSLADVNGLLAANLRIGFQASVLSLQSVATGTLTSGWNLQTNTSTANQVTLVMASGTPISGSGTIAKLTFSVVGAVASQSPLTLSQVSLNDGAITTHASDGLFVVNGTFDLSGAVKYFLDERPVAAANLALIGIGEQHRETNSQGQFSFDSILTGPYTLRPSKSDDVVDITAHDASLVLRHVAGPQTLSATQLVAADVNRSGAVTALDAAYILQKSVGLISGTFPGAGKHWDFLPDERAYPLFGNSLQNQDFTAVLIGDVSGNWNSGAGQGQGFDDGSWGAQAMATLSLDHAVGNVGDNVSLPLNLSRNGTQPHSLDLRINYDPDRLRFVGITSDSDWSSAHRLAAPGEVRVAMAGAETLPDHDVLLNAEFEILADVRTPVRVTLAQALLEEGLVGAVLQHGYVGAVELPQVGMTNLFTSSTSPQLTGTIDDHSATVEVLLNDQTYRAINRGDGTWLLPAGVVDPPLVDGSHNVVIRATDTLSRIGTAELEDGVIVDRLAPRVAGAYVRGTTWSAGYLQVLQNNGLGSAFGGFQLADGAAQLAAQNRVTWQLVNQIAVGFDQDVIVDPAAIRLFGSGDIAYAVTEGGFSYDPVSFIARWNLTQPIPLGKFLISIQADRIVDRAGNALDGEWVTSQTTYDSSGDGTAGGDFNFRFDYLPGDINRNGQTNLADSNQIRVLGTRLPDATNFRMDVNASNQINLADSNIIRSMGTRTLFGMGEPTNPPAPPAGGFSGMGAAGDFGIAGGDDDSPRAAPAPEAVPGLGGLPGTVTVSGRSSGTDSESDNKHESLGEWPPATLPMDGGAGEMTQEPLVVDVVFEQFATFDAEDSATAHQPSALSENSPLLPGLDTFW